MSESYGLINSMDQQVPLQGVAVEGDLVGRAARLTIRQKFTNMEKIPVEARFSNQLLTELESKGHSFQVMGEMDLFFGGVQLIVVDQEKHELIGASDPRRSGVAIGY